MLCCISFSSRLSSPALRHFLSLSLSLFRSRRTAAWVCLVFVLESDRLEKSRILSFLTDNVGKNLSHNAATILSAAKSTLKNRTPRRDDKTLANLRDTRISLCFYRNLAAKYKELVNLFLFCSYVTYREEFTLVFFYSTILLRLNWKFFLSFYQKYSTSSIAQYYCNVATQAVLRVHVGDVKVARERVCAWNNSSRRRVTTYTYTCSG